MGQKVVNVDLTKHMQGSVVVDWRVHLHCGDCNYDSDSPAAMTGWSSAKANSGNMDSFAAAMSTIASAWWSSLPTTHVNSDGVAISYRDALRLAVAAS